MSVQQGYASRPEWQSGVPHSTRAHTIFGFSFLGMLFLGFGVWANWAPIAGAIVTSGVFVTSGQNKTIQHLEGGVIKEIKVREGDVVTPGQTLIVLDDTSARTELRRLVLRRDRLAAIEARLLAEMREEPQVVFPEVIVSNLPDEDYRAMVFNQQLEFDAHRKNLDSNLAELNDGIDALEEKIKGSRLQRDAMQQEIDLFQQELDTKNALLKSGEVRKSEVLALQRAVANAQGEIGQLDGDIGDAKERIVRTKEEMISARTSVIKAAAEQLNDVHAEQNDVRERIRAATRVLDRVAITAPVAGVVVKLRFHTAGGVIEPGSPIMDIVPVHDELLIEARVRPQDIANLSVGQSANIRLTALSQRVTPMVTGKVIYVSADTLPDDKRTMAGPVDQYVARIELDAEGAAKIRDFSPVPGMPAEVYIKTSEHTFFQYLLKPLKDSMQRAFREK